MKEIEKIFLGKLMVDPEIIEQEELTDCIFESQKNKDIFNTIREIQNVRGEVNEITVCERGKGKNFTATDIAEIPQTFSANYSYYLSELKNGYEKKELSKLLLQARGWVVNENVSESLDRLECEISRIMSVKREGIHDKNNLIMDTIKHIEKSINSGVRVGISTGYEKLDRLILGFDSEDFVIIGARPSLGKTTFMLNLMINILSQNIGVGIVSCEMSAKMLCMKMFSYESKVSLHKLRAGKLQKDEYTQLMNAGASFYGRNFMIADEANAEFLSVKNIIRKMVRDGASIVFIDYLQLVNFKGNIPRYEKVAEISKGLKQLTRELKIPIVALSQLTRDTEGKKPSLSSIRDSGSIEQDADIIIFLHGKRESEEREIIVAKARNAQIGSFKLTFKGEHSRFYE